VASASSEFRHFRHGTTCAVPSFAALEIDWPLNALFLIEERGEGGGDEEVGLGGGGISGGT